MEGPSLFLAAEQLAPFVGHTINTVSGNTKIGKERLIGKKVDSIFSFGKYLFFQFDEFALRVHFLLWGSFQSTIHDVKVTGDYPPKGNIRLGLEFDIGSINMFSCSVHFIEHADARQLCDFTIDTMSDVWDEKRALQKIKKEKESEIADVLLDQTVFAGVGNIIKNEVLLLARTSPLRKIRELSTAKLREIVSLVRQYVFDFYRWRKKFELKKHYRIYRQSVCKECGGKVTRQKTGIRKRISYICPNCEE